MKKTIGIQITVFALLFISTSFNMANAAGGFTTEVFDATLKSKNPWIGETSMRSVSDGKGHLRNESTFNGFKTISILDYPNEIQYNISEADHKVTKMPFHPAPEMTASAALKKADATSLGAKIIDGYPCHGIETKGSFGKCQTWTGDKIHYLVLSEADSPNGKITMSLQSFSSKMPSPECFEVPAGYTVSEGK